MSSLIDLNSAFESYKKLLEELEKFPSAKNSDSCENGNQGNPSAQLDAKVLEVLQARDKLHTELTNEIKTNQVAGVADQGTGDSKKVSSEGNGQGSKILDLTGIIIELVKEDERLKLNAYNVGWSEKVDSWRFNKGISDDHWWWNSSKLRPQRTPTSETAFKISAYIIWVPVIGLMLTISSALARAILINTNIFGFSAIAFQALLGFIATKVTLSDSNKILDDIIKFISPAIKPVNKTRSGQENIARLAIVLVMGSLSWVAYRFAFPEVSKRLVGNGIENYHNGKYYIAQTNVKQALELDSENSETLHLMAEISESLSDIDPEQLKEAEEYYYKASARGFEMGNVGLARLQILSSNKEENTEKKQEKYFTAISILTTLKSQVACPKAISEAGEILIADGDGDGDKDFDDFENKYYTYYNFCTTLGWAYLELYRTYSSQNIENESDPKREKENAKDALYALDRSKRYLDFAIDARNEAIKKNIDSADENAFQHMLTISTADCLRAQLQELMIQELLVDDNQLRKDNKFNPAKYWNSCSTALEAKDKDKSVRPLRAYEVKWLKIAQENDQEQ